jgi:hypothetical protein
VEYDRHETQEEADLLNELYTRHCISWSIGSFPAQKLLHKVRTGSHTSPRCMTRHKHSVHGCSHG